MPYIQGVAQAPRTFDPTTTTRLITGLVNGTTYRFDVAAVNGIGAGKASELSASVTPAADYFTPLAPVRVVDSRPGTQVGPFGSPWGVGTTRDVAVTGGSSGVPSDADAVVLNVTATGTTAPSYLTVWPKGQPKPLASSVNWAPGWTVPNSVTVKVGDGGNVSVFNNLGGVDVIVDVVGYYNTGTGAGFHPVSPGRILDSRPATNVGLYATPWLTGLTRNVKVTGGAPGVPDNAVGVLMNVTVTGTSGLSYLTMFPMGQPKPVASNLNWIAGWTIANSITAKVGTSGNVSVYNNSGSADVIADVAGLVWLI